MIEELFLGKPKQYWFDLTDSRRKTCASCEYKVQVTEDYSMCNHCGCDIYYKTNQVYEKCPLNKW